MKLPLIALLSAGAALTLSAADESPLKTPRDKVSYSIGLNIGNSLKQYADEVDLDVLHKALKDVLGTNKLLVTEAEARETIMAFQTEFRTKQLDKNKKDGEKFLVDNKTKEGVKTLPSGLQYKIATKGEGKIPGSNDTVVAHYRGTLIDGTEFDSSYKRGEPTPFPVLGVIKGWTEALLQMPVGSKWQLFIPSDLAYGERGNRGIPPNSTLMFDIELISIQDPAATPVPGAGPTPGAGALPSKTIKLDPKPAKP